MIGNPAGDHRNAMFSRLSEPWSGEQQMLAGRKRLKQRLIIFDEHSLSCRG